MIAIGWAGQRDGLSKEQSAQDAVHNIPHLLQRWETCDEPLLRSFLQAFDDKWAGKVNACLLATYERVLGQERSS